MTDRYTIESPDLDAAYAAWPPHDAAMRRSHLADDAWRAWNGRAPSDPRQLVDFQQERVAEELRSIAQAARRREASRARLALAGAPAPAKLAPLNPDDPDSLEAHGYPFRARALRARWAEVEHASRRKRVEAQVAQDERQFDRFATAYGEPVAERMMRTGQWTPDGDAA